MKAGARVWLPAALSGLLGALAFPPSPFWLLGLLAWVPLISVVDQGQRGFRPFFLAGLVYHGFTVYWIALNSDPPFYLAFASFLGALLWLCTLWGVVGWFAVRARRWWGRGGLALFPLIMTAIDWIVEGGEMGFPWNTIGVGQATNPLLRSLVAAGGMHVLTLLSLTINLLVWVLLLNNAQDLYKSRVAKVLGWVAIPCEERATKSATSILAFFALLLLPLLSYEAGQLASAGIHPASQSRVPMLLVQSGVSGREKWENPYQYTVDRHLELTQQALQERADQHLKMPEIVLWSETAVPTRLRMRRPLQQQLIQFCRYWNVDLITGANDVTRTEAGARPQNAAFVLDSEGMGDFYAKRRLVPFGERVPGQRWLPLLGKLNLGQAEFLAGNSVEPGQLELANGDSLRIGWSICFEGNFGELAREFCLRGAGLLVNLTNDSWFRMSREYEQHLTIAALRCLECGRWMARATSNGYTAFINPQGKIVDILPKGSAGTLYHEVEVLDGLTWYTRFGPVVPRAAAILALVLLLLGWMRNRFRHGREAQS